MTLYRGGLRNLDTAEFTSHQPWVNRYAAYGPVMSQRVNVIYTTSQRYRRTEVNHLLHFGMTLLTCGFWLPVWIGCVAWSVLRDRLITGRW